MSHGRGCGFVWVKLNDVYYVSVYLIPNDRIADFQDELDSLEDAIQNLQEKLVAGDLNAKASE